jgi:RNA polymerase sigma-70 factor (ECF subfamily)
MFPTTQWDIVLQAKDEHSIAQREALSRLCESYWRPVYLYVRHRGYSQEKVEDLCQEFFATLIEKNYLKYVHEERGSFRGFLRMAVRHFLANEWDKAMAQKRGGEHFHVAVDSKSAEAQLKLPGTDRLSPDELYDRTWALMIAENAMNQLRNEYHRNGKNDVFDALRSALTSNSDLAPYKEIAANLDIKPAYVRVLVQRMRKRYAALMLEEVAQTLAPHEDAKEEFHYLINLLKNG